MKKVILVTVHFNSDTETHDLLTSLKKINKENFDFSILVIDNFSKIPFILTKEEKNNNITLLRTDKNLGFTGGYNLGIEQALLGNADYVVVINNDTLVQKDFINNFLETFASNPDCGMVVPKIYFAKGHEYHKERYADKELGKVIWYAGGFMDWNNVFSKHRGLDEVDHGQYDVEKKVDFATGCCIGISKDALSRLLGFDNSYFLYFEDADMSQRALRNGFSIVYNPKSVIWHVNAASSGSGSDLHDYYLTRNRMLFGMKYAPIRSKIALLKESLRLLLFGREWQKKGIKDFYLRKFGRGSFGI